jgi:hypothetical protein
MVCGNGDGSVESGVSQRDGIEASLGEGMAAAEAAEGQPRALEDTEPDEGDVGVLGAGGEIAALSRT